MRQSRTQRRLAAGAFLILAGPLALGSVAYACQALATLHSNPRSTTAGSTVQLYGRGYSSSAANTPIEIRLDGRAGRLLASFTPRSVINNEPVTIPADVPVGTHTLLAIQYTAAGNAVSGTPGRASVVLTVAPRTSSESSAAGSATVAAADPAAPAAAAAATPAAATPASQAASASASAPASAPAPAIAATVTQAVAAAPAAAVASAPAAADGTSPAGAAVSTGGPAAPAPAAAAEQTAAAAGPASLNVGLAPASSSESSSPVPGLTLAAGLALVLLGLGAFIKSGRSMLGRNVTPLAG